MRLIHSCEVLTVCFLLVATASADEMPALSKYLVAREAEFDQIPAERRVLLDELATYVRHCQAVDQVAQMTFICTHNSRRSHLSQIWAAVAADHYGISPVKTYSGGTETTAFNPRAVAALRRAGLQIPEPTTDANPHYLVSFSTDPQALPLECFSKQFLAEPNPTGQFCAVMTCSSADKTCPLVPGAVARIPIRYEDPKVADNTPEEAAVYDERCRQIAREMLYAFSRVKSASSTSAE